MDQKEAMQGGFMHLDCVTEPEYDAWAFYAKRSPQLNTVPAVVGAFCSDCLPEYRNDQEAKGLCTLDENIRVLFLGKSSSS